MQIFEFINNLKTKINNYDKMITNPFETPHPMTIVWIDSEEKSSMDKFRVFKPPNHNS